MDAEINMLFVGDFFQHTFDTSRDGNVNKSLFNNKLSYEERFQKRGFFVILLHLLKVGGVVMRFAILLQIILV